MIIENNRWSPVSNERRDGYSRPHPFERLLTTPASISDDQRRYAGLGGLEKYKGNIAIAASELNITNRQVNSSDERDLINAAKAVVELDFISSIPPKQRNRNILKRAADLKLIAKSAKFPNIETFIELKKQVQERVTSGALKLSAAMEARLGSSMSRISLD